MLVIPAVDLRGGKVVRLFQGAFDRETVYSNAPEEVVMKWESEGAKLIHVVDLDGAQQGHRQNLGSLKNILAVAKVPIQFGGGLRSYESVREVLDAGVWRAVIGTKALDSDLIQKLVRNFGERIAIGLDVRHNVIQTHGWQTEHSEQTLETVVQQLGVLNVRAIICTDISRDGTLQGPNIGLLNDLLAQTKMDVILSGGISSLAHLKRLAEIKTSQFKGVIIGKALYEQRFSLREAVKQFEGVKR